jgi:hypothetical protein
LIVDERIAVGWALERDFDRSPLLDGLSGNDAAGFEDADGGFLGGRIYGDESGGS